jgi:hypothetical protein
VAFSLYMRSRQRRSAPSTPCQGRATVAEATRHMQPEEDAFPSPHDQTQRPTLAFTEARPASEQMAGSSGRPAASSVTLSRSHRAGANTNPRARPRPSTETRCQLPNSESQRPTSPIATDSETGSTQHRSEGCSENRASAHHKQPQGMPQGANTHPTQPVPERRRSAIPPPQLNAGPRPPKRKESGRSIGCDSHRII